MSVKFFLDSEAEPFEEVLGKKASAKVQARPICSVTNCCLSVEVQCDYDVSQNHCEISKFNLRDYKAATKGLLARIYLCEEHGSTFKAPVGWSLERSIEKAKPNSAAKKLPAQKDSTPLLTRAFANKRR